MSVRVRITVLSGPVGPKGSVEYLGQTVLGFELSIDERRRRGDEAES